MEDTVWLYWENTHEERRAGWLEACLESIRYQARGLSIRLLGRDDVLTWLPEIDAELWHGLPTPVFRSDYARVRLLLEYGGIWIDVDTIALSPLERMIEEIDHRRFVSWGADLDGRCYNGVMASVRGADFLGQWATRQDEVIAGTRKSGRALAYSALGQDIAHKLAGELPWKSLPQARIAPIMYNRWRAFMSPYLSPRRLMEPDPLLAVLWNSAMGPSMASYSASDLFRRSPILLARLLRLGTGRSALDEEEADIRTRLDILPRARYSDTGVRVELRVRRALTSLNDILNR